MNDVYILLAKSVSTKSLSNACTDSSMSASASRTDVTVVKLIELFYFWRKHDRNGIEAFFGLRPLNCILATATRVLGSPSHHRSLRVHYRKYPDNTAVRRDRSGSQSARHRLLEGENN